MNNEWKQWPCGNYHEGPDCDACGHCPTAHEDNGLCGWCYQMKKKCPKDPINVANFYFFGQTQ